MYRSQVIIWNTKNTSLEWWTETQNTALGWWFETEKVQLNGDNLKHKKYNSRVITLNTKTAVLGCLLEICKNTSLEWQFETLKVQI